MTPVAHHSRCAVRLRRLRHADLRRHAGRSAAPGRFCARTTTTRYPEHPGRVRRCAAGSRRLHHSLVGTHLQHRRGADHLVLLSLQPRGSTTAPGGLPDQHDRSASSTYVGGQEDLRMVSAAMTLETGVFGFGQPMTSSFHVLFNDASNAPVQQSSSRTGTRRPAYRGGHLQGDHLAHCRAACGRRISPG